MIDAVIFDFDSTLVDYHYVDTKAIYNVVNMLPKPINKDLFLDKSGEIICNIYDSGLQLGSGVHKERLKKTIEYFDLEWNESYINEYLKIYCTETKPYNYCTELLKSIKGKTKIGLLTNSMDSKEQRARIENSKLSMYFDAICIASEIECYKPDIKAFKIVLEMLNARPWNSVYVGDSEDYDIKGAKNAKMIAIKKDNKTIKPTVADYRFSSFRELHKILDEIGLNEKRNRPTIALS